jgi:hypothetical protein
MNRVLFAGLSLGIVALGYCGFFAGTAFTQDDFVWLCFAKFYPEPLAVFWRDTLCWQFFRPMGQMWWQAIYFVASDTLWPYQVGFLLTHLVNALLVARLAGQFAGSVAGRFAGLCFALSPLFVESLSGHYLFIFDLLGFLFFSSALVSIGVYARTGRSTWSVVSLLAALGAFLSKESYFTLPALVVVMLGLDDESRWSWTRLKPRLSWVALHGCVLLAAVAWRSAVIGGLGGYGLADLSGASKLLLHLTDRGSTWIGFAGWTLAPFLARWSPADYWPVVGSLLLMGTLTAVSCTERRRGRTALWCWVWMLVTWSPSIVMSTYAPVSWYPCTLGSALLASLVLERLKWRYVFAFAFALYLSLNGLLYYRGNEAYVRVLRSQQSELQQQFPLGGSSLPAGHRYFLFHCAFDLYPDPIVKLGTPHGAPMADVMFFNAEAPIGWVITNTRGYDVWPMRVAPMFQREYMDMIAYRAVPLVFGDRHEALARAGPRFHFLRWVNGELVDISDQIRVEAPDQDH